VSDTARQWFKIENAAAQVADVSIFDEISPWGVTAQDFVSEIKGITAPRTNLHLNTPGGDVFDGIAIFNAIKDHPSEFHVFIPGICASIGTVIAMAASRIVIAPHARMMIHEAWGGTMGDAAEMAKMAERLEATSQNIATIYAERGGGTADEWRALMKAETWYTDQQAVDAGLADEVGRSNDASAGKQAALFNLSRYRNGERIAAQLRADFGVEVAEHVCACGECGAAITAQVEEPPAPAPDINPFVQEREELEGLIASVRI
jgi:ATP-dependent protease ClpP protease subunit